MNTQGNHAIRRASVMIALVSIIAVAVQASIAGHSIAATQSVSFELSSPSIGFTAAISTGAAWNSEQSVKKGDAATIAYTLTSQPGSASLTVPLSQLDLGLGLEDETVTVALPDAPLGAMSISLTQILGIPQGVASVNLVLEGSVRVVQVTSTSSSIEMLTDINELVWTSWGSKSVSLLTSEKVDATVRATLEYTLSVGIQVTTLLTGSQVLIPTTPISGVSGTPLLATSISVSDSSTLLMIAGIGAAASCAAVVAVIVILRRRSKKDMIGKTGGSQHP